MKQQIRTKTKICVRVILLLLICNYFTAFRSIMADTNMLEFSRKLAIFSINMYNKLALLRPNDNIIYSPFSIQTCGAMVRIGAEHQTAVELDQGLSLISNNVNEIAEHYNSILSSYENSSFLHIANKIYIMRGYTIRDDFNELLTKKFLSSAEELDFGKSAQAADIINEWIETKTNRLIKKLVPESALDKDTRIILINAIHFKGDWVHSFPKHLTHNEDFYLNETDSIKVKMMNVRGHFHYVELSELNAQVLEMPYKNSDLSMLVILPNERNGLKQLEDKLKSVPLAQITQQLELVNLNVKFPKFKAEFYIELNEALKQLGIARMFSRNAELGKMLRESEELQVTKVLHKAIIDVNEVGTEAAAATSTVVRMKRSLILNHQFNADHPFIFILKHTTNENAVILFMGSVVKPDEIETNELVSHDEL